MNPRTAFPHPIRADILTRDGNACAKCGGRRGLRIHRRQPVTRTAADGVTMCSTCRDWITGNPELATIQGWLVPNHRDTSEVPVNHQIYGHVTLTTRGTVTIHDRELDEDEED